MARNMLVDIIAELTAGVGVTVDGLKLKDSGIVLGSDANGDIYYRSGGVLVRLAKGTARQVLQINSGATAPEWAASPQSVLTAQADLLYASGANTLARLVKGTGLQFLRMNAGATAPEWAAGATLTVSETEVFNGNSPNPAAWTDLDLSGTVGS